MLDFGQTALSQTQSQLGYPSGVVVSLSFIIVFRMSPIRSGRNSSRHSIRRDESGDRFAQHRRLLKSKKAQKVAGSIFFSLKKKCARVVKRKGAAIRS